MTVDLYIFEQEEPARSVLDYLHHLILHLQPSIDHAIKWNIPFYTVKGPVVYLNPLKAKSGGVEICFPRGKHFNWGSELLDFKDRKVVGGYIVQTLETIDEKVVKKLIKEALATDIRLAGTSPWK